MNIVLSVYCPCIDHYLLGSPLSSTVTEHMYNTTYIHDMSPKAYLQAKTQPKTEQNKKIRKRIIVFSNVDRYEKSLIYVYNYHGAQRASNRSKIQNVHNIERFNLFIVFNGFVVICFISCNVFILLLSAVYFCLLLHALTKHHILFAVFFLLCLNSFRVVFSSPFFLIFFVLKS